MTRRTQWCERREERQMCGRHRRVRDGKRDTRAKGRVMDRETQTERHRQRDTDRETQTKHARGTGKRRHRLRETEKEHVWVFCERETEKRCASEIDYFRGRQTKDVRQQETRRKKIGEAQDKQKRWETEDEEGSQV